MLSMVIAYVKLFMRQIKNFVWSIFAWLKRFMSMVIRRNHSSNGDLHDSHVHDSEMCFNDFVVIEKSSYDAGPNGDGQNATTSNVGKFPHVQSFGPQDYNYSDYSLTSSMGEQQQHQAISMVSNVSHEKRHSYSQRQQQNSKEEKKEEDYFQDMVPEFKKPKTIYITKQDTNDDELNVIGQRFDQNIAKKFRVQDTQRFSMVEMMDETKFTRNPLGRLEDDLTKNDHDYYGANQLEAAATSNTWEEMADEEDLWNNTDETLQELRIQKREQRLREHQLKKQMKRSKNTR